jgi:hypothetical protein
MRVEENIKAAQAASGNPFYPSSDLGFSHSCFNRTERSFLSHCSQLQRTNHRQSKRCPGAILGPVNPLKPTTAVPETALQLLPAGVQTRSKDLAGGHGGPLTDSFHRNR